MKMQIATVGLILANPRTRLRSPRIDREDGSPVGTN